ncbi:MAG: hypothetical protein M1822_004770 [Bathelium mastoideum]|nr:MAG: hypothetical protein M1822_004770 [Bathelium mastoideum]
MPLLLLYMLLQLQWLLQVTASTSSPDAMPQTLNITAIATNAQKESILECWQLDNPFVASTASGTSGAVFAQLGKAGATSYGIIPADFDGGLHNAPVVQWVAFLAGEAVISLPNSTQEARVQGGRHGLILATDTANVSSLGHITKYPKKQETVAIQIPIADNKIPSHDVLHSGACKLREEDN